MDTAAPFEWSDTTAAMRIVKANEGNVIDAATEERKYYVEIVSNEKIPDNERPVDIAPDTPIYRSIIHSITADEYAAYLPAQMDIPSCYRYPYYGHELFVRVRVSYFT